MKRDSAIYRKLERMVERSLGLRPKQPRTFFRQLRELIERPLVSRIERIVQAKTPQFGKAEDVQYEREMLRLAVLRRKLLDRAD